MQCVLFQVYLQIPSNTCDQKCVYCGSEKGLTIDLFPFDFVDGVGGHSAAQVCDVHCIPLDKAGV